MPHFRSDRDFEAEMDADAVARAIEIQDDPKRVQRAKVAAVRKVAEAQEVANKLGGQPSGAGAEEMLSLGFSRIEKP